MDWRERDGHAEAAPFRDLLTQWAKQTIGDLRAARPDIPKGLGDRQANAWEPLLAIADAAGDEWSSLARRSALALSGEVDDNDINVQLLRDIKILFDLSGERFLSSTELIKRLSDVEDRPWCEWKDGKPITPRAVADRLKLFGIIPRPNGLGTARGYYRDRFEEEWIRYKDPTPSNRQTPFVDASQFNLSRRQEAVDTHTSLDSSEPSLSGGFDASTEDKTPNGHSAPSSGHINGHRPKFQR